MPKETKEFNIVSGTRPKGEEGVDWVSSVIGRAWGKKDTGYTVYASVPKTEEDAVARGTTLNGLVAQGMLKLFTMVDYTVGFDYKTDDDGKIITSSMTPKPDCLALLQKAVDEYVFGMKRTSVARATREKANKVDSFEEEFGDFDTFRELLKSDPKLAAAIKKAQANGK